MEAPVDGCPQCQGTLENVVTHVQYQTDVPPVQPTVTQINVQVGYCPCCGLRAQGTHPEQTSHSLGADFQGLVAWDDYLGYDIFRTARCNAHPIRRVRDLLDPPRVSSRLCRRFRFC